MASSTILLITGANTGLGFETVKALCRSSKSYTILLGGRNLDKAKAAAQTAKQEYPDSPSAIAPIQVDVEDDDSISQALDHISSQYGRLDVLINNAGEPAGRLLSCLKLMLCRCSVGSSVRSWEDDDEGDVEQFLECQCHWHIHPHSYCHASPPQILRSKAHLHHKRHINDGGEW